MKAKLFSILTGIALVFSMAAKAQLAYAEPSKRSIPRYLRAVKENVTGPAYYNNISARAFRNFVTNFPGASNENWFCTVDLSVVTFMLNDITYRVDYDKKGNWIETFRNYGEVNMAADLRRSVKDSYYDYNIYLIQEIEQPFQPIVYVIHLVGKGKLINLQVCDEVMTEWQKFKKSE